MRAVRLVRRSLRQIREDGLHGVHNDVPEGYLRGVELLGDEFEPSLIRSVEIYHRNHDHWPTLIDPPTFTNKQLLFKFFGLIPRATPSDKLLAYSYLPDDFRDQVLQPKIYWKSPAPELPGNDAIAPGTYWYKSNHGSGTNLPVTFPVPGEKRAELSTLARRWLTRIHSARLGLWWYEIMDRYVYLEEDLREGDDDAADWKFYVCNGRVVIYQHDADRSGEHKQTVYTRDGTYLNKRMYFRLNGARPVAAPEKLDVMVAAAEAIGQFFDFIRVDMFIRSGRIYLGEIGLVPNGCTKRIRAPELDWMLGGAWHAPWMGRVDKTFSDGHYHRARPFGG